jgi:hypothetical protein
MAMMAITTNSSIRVNPGGDPRLDVMMNPRIIEE